jgi:hypothetical protein
VSLRPVFSGPPDFLGFGTVSIEIWLAFSRHPLKHCSLSH